MNVTKDFSNMLIKMFENINVKKVNAENINLKKKCLKNRS